MPNHSDLPTQVEDSLMAWGAGLTRILADDNVDEKERAELREMKGEIAAATIPVGQIRLTFRLIRRATVCGVDELVDKHIRYELEDLQRRREAIGKAALRVRYAKRPRFGR